jgi:hypothetical protein
LPKQVASAWHKVFRLSAPPEGFRRAAATLARRR